MMSLILGILLFVGAFSVFIALMNLFAPKEEETAVVDVAIRKFKSSSSFAKLQPDDSIFDRIAVFCLQTFGLESKLEEMHMQLGSPDKPQPVDILYTKIIAAFVLPLALMLLFQSFWPFFLIPLGFILPDIIIKSKIA